MKIKEAEMVLTLDKEFATGLEEAKERTMKEFKGKVQVDTQQGQSN